MRRASSSPWSPSWPAWTGSTRRSARTGRTADADAPKAVIPVPGHPSARMPRHRDHRERGGRPRVCKEHLPGVGASESISERDRCDALGMESKGGFTRSRPRRRPGALAVYGAAGALALAGLCAGAGAAESRGDRSACRAEACADDSSQKGSHPVAVQDDGVNVFVGGDFRVREGAAGAEGKVIVLGGFDMDKSGEGYRDAYRVGGAGPNARYRPEAGSDFMTVGADVAVAEGQRLLAEQDEVHGVVRYGGTLVGAVSPSAVHDPRAADSFRGIRERVEEASACYAYPEGRLREPTGTALDAGAATVFTGDGTSRLQVFNVDFDLSDTGGRPQRIVFREIPPEATVLVNVAGEDPVVDTYSGSLPDGLRGRLLW